MARSLPRLARRAIALLPLLVSLFVVSTALAANHEAEAREIGRALQCPICQNISVADSTTELAGQMRETIRRKLEAGESREAIVSYFVDRYGEDVLLDPPKRGFTLLVWAGPVLALVLGAVVVAMLLPRWRRRPPAPTQLAAEDEAAYAARLRRDLVAPETGP